MFHHLFVMDALQNLNLKLDTSLRFCRALISLGHKVWFAEPSDLYWRTGNRRAEVRAKPLSFPAKTIDSIVLGVESSFPLTEFHAVHMRKDPPFDLDYIGTTWLLETVCDKVRVYNDPRELRSINEKLAIFQFPEESRPGLLSARARNLLDFLEGEAQGDAVLKPLHLYGGRGVRRIKLSETGRDNALRILEQETSGGKSWRLIQAFDPAIFEGEVRVFTVGGNPLAWCLKVPAGGSFLANTAAGATLHPFEPSPAIMQRVERVAKALAEKGVFFVGFDIINGYISEINITSPRLLAPEQDRTDYYKTMAEWTNDDLNAFQAKRG